APPPGWCEARWASAMSPPTRSWPAPRPRCCAPSPTRTVPTDRPGSGMRVLLAAVDAQKGDLDGTLARHLAVLEQARTQGCDLAVFPEFSLTGSVAPRRHPERALSVDAALVRALLQAT